ncbi:hypothetical protein BDB00DRAFT_823164 [Zychaea mexicana]|uniref:uncharacterized protein n=1 Tax=Zychaea mexicana TaxID=64656 RepID=UPI0022FF401D|nr:uncharacterized protein BDB00DRAFT_823164 [Zychaea mexicana]KAI9493463.1 hypothetical protein BDB00DRAFT_823164 [Zychaea mexicana]
MAQVVASLKRRLETILEDFKRARATWHEISTDGFSTANALVNATIQSRYVDEPAYWHPALLQEFPNVVHAYHKKMEWIIKQNHEKLSTIALKMGKQHEKMKQQVAEVQAISKRLCDLQGETFVQSVPLYKTCPMIIYVNRITSIVAMYASAMKTVDTLLGEKGMSNVRSRQEGLALLSTWINHPSINDSVISEFDDLCRIEIYDT